MPPAEEKPYWQRYIYLWINYALYEELDAGDVKRARDVYRVNRGYKQTTATKNENRKKKRPKGLLGILSLKVIFNFQIWGIGYKLTSSPSTMSFEIRRLGC